MKITRKNLRRFIMEEMAANEDLALDAELRAATDQTSPDPFGYEDEFVGGAGYLAEKKRQKYGGNKGDESRSKRDYMDEEWGGKKGDESKSRRDYMEEEYGGNKGDESRSHRDYMDEEYGGNKGDESKSHRDYMDEEWGGKKGDESKSRRDYMDEEWGTGMELDDPHADDMPAMHAESRRRRARKINARQLRKLILQEMRNLGL